MSAPQTSQVDLAKLFNAVARTLKENQQDLNSADEFNHNHGDNMVDNFQVITKAMRETKGCTPSEQLAHASQVLSQRSTSSSAQLYSQGLAQASEQLRGQSLITPENAMMLVQALMAGQQQNQSPAPQSPSGGMGDLLGGLLGSFMGSQPGESQQAQPGAGDLLGSLLGGQPGIGQQAEPQAPAGGDLLGGLMGALMGGQPAETSAAGQPEASQGGIDLNTLLAAGMAFFQARQQGAEPVQALTQAVMAGSQMMGTAHHSQSGQLVAQTLISTLGTMLAGRK